MIQDDLWTAKVNEVQIEAHSIIHGVAAGGL